MDSADSRTKGYALAALLGAIGGGLVVLIATRAIPKMMFGQMHKMMARMKEDGCEPSEM